MDNYVFRRVINQIDVDPSQHYFLPSHNQLDVEFLSKISKNLDDLEEESIFEDDNSKSFLSTFPCYENFNYKAGLSFVLHCGNGMVDKAEELIKIKLQWAKKLKTLIPKKEQEALAELGKLKKSVKKNDSGDLKISGQGFLDHFLNEPEPSFKGPYNWQYTGGCVSSIQHNGDIYLCCADTLGNSPVIKLLKLNEDCTKVNDEQIFYLKTDLPVLQVCLSKMEEDIIIAVRQKTRFTMLSALNGRGTIIRKWKKSLAVDRVLTSIDIDPGCEKIAVTDADMNSRYIKVHSVETNQRLYKNKNNVKTAKDSWNKVLFRDVDVLFADRTNFCIIDQRAGDKFSLQYSPFLKHEYECDTICNMLKCESDPNFVYLPTTHGVIQLDVRFPKPIQKWTHLMQSCPQQGNVVVDANTELILLQGMNLDDFVGITNERIQENDELHLLSKSTPSLLKSMKNSIRIAQYNGLCLNAAMNKRFDCTVTGSCVVKDKSDASHYFVTNAFGYVYGCKIKRKDDDVCDDLDNMLESMKIYESHIQDLNIGQTVHFPEVRDMSHIFQKVEEIGLMKDPKLKIKRAHVHWKYREMYAPESLKMYKDYLAKKITPVWGISNSDDEEAEDDDVSVTNKVEGWLQQME